MTAVLGLFLGITLTIVSFTGRWRAVMNALFPQFGHLRQTDQPGSGHQTSGDTTAPAGW